MASWRWYLTIAAVRQWMDLTDRRGPLEDDNPDFVAAQNGWGELSLTARLSESASAKTQSGRLRVPWPRHGQGQERAQNAQ